MSSEQQQSQPQTWLSPGPRPPGADANAGGPGSDRVGLGARNALGAKSAVPFAVGIRGLLPGRVVGPGAAYARRRQVRDEKTNASELLMTCRKFVSRCRNRGVFVAPGSVRTAPVDGPHGIRHGGGVSQIWTIVRNVGTCRCGVKGEPRWGKTSIGRVPIRGTGTELLVVVMRLL